MKKLLIVPLLILSFLANSQSILTRGTAANTIQDYRLMVPYNFFVPRYADTTAANFTLGIDSCGAIIFAY
jgi:hypothetical protein